MSDVENERALKHLFDQKLLNRMAESIAEVYPKFDRKRLTSLMPKLKPLEMKPRVRLLRDQLRPLLPADYVQALNILRKAGKTAKLNGFDLWPFTEFVQTFGLDDLEASLKALSEFTVLFTSEWAVRPFIKSNPKATMAFLLKCAGDKNVHLRRWASEGTRPRLPWGERLQAFVKDPTPTFRILEKLKFDEELYVRKSVSNHLNDIAKDHPDLVVELLQKWKREAGPKNLAKIDWITHRSLRSLIKEGHAGALLLVGVTPAEKVKISNLKVKHREVRMGEKINFEFTLHSSAAQPQKLVVDYVMHFVKSNQSNAVKVFKLKTFELDPNETVAITKAHPIKQMTTRKYYPGLHHLEIQVNGTVVKKISWRLTC